MVISLVVGVSAEGDNQSVNDSEVFNQVVHSKADFHLD